MGLSISKYLYSIEEDKNNNQNKEDKVNPKEECQEECQEDVDETLKEFREYDKNKDNIITWEEFNQVFKEKLGKECTKADLWKFLGMDKNGDAEIDYSEYKVSKSNENFQNYQTSSSWY